MGTEVQTKVDALEILGVRKGHIEIKVDGDDVKYCQAYVNDTHTYRDGTDGYKTIEKMIGRIANIEYMAAAIDEHQGNETGPLSTKDKDGKEQFLYLLSEKNFKDEGRFYIILRKYHKKKDYARLRAGLTLLLAIESGVISYDDAVNLVYNMHSVSKD